MSNEQFRYTTNNENAYYAVRFGKPGESLAFDLDGGAYAGKSGRMSWHLSLQSAQKRAEVLQSYGHTITQILRVVEETRPVTPEFETVRF